MRPFSRRLLFATTVLPFHRALAANLAATPAQTEGPFYPVAFPANSDNDLVQVRGQAAHAMGAVLHLQGRVLDASGKPLSGAVVDLAVRRARDLRSPEPAGTERRDSAFQGYGQFVSDQRSHYGFRTLKPAAYPGRTPHIHRKLRRPTSGGSRTQFYLAGDPQNEQDFVYRAAVRDPRARERIEMRPEPAPGIEPEALWASMDIVIA